VKAASPVRWGALKKYEGMGWVVTGYEVLGVHQIKNRKSKSSHHMVSAGWELRCSVCGESV